MANEVTINFNGRNYIATYNRDSGYYELEIGRASCRERVSASV